MVYLYVVAFQTSRYNYISSFIFDPLLDGYFFVSFCFINIERKTLHKGLPRCRQSGQRKIQYGRNSRKQQPPHFH